MAESPNLTLPLLESGQAQKHVTHNEALRLLDTLVQLAVLDRGVSSPPTSPAEGERWIVGASPSGAFAGHGDEVAAWQDGGWQFSAPQAGWVAFVVDEATLYYWTGSSWDSLQGAITALQNLSLLGVGTTADATNPLAAKLNNILFTAKYASESGDGDLRCKLNKEGAGDTVSQLYQTNYSGRAETGLIGNDDFTFKVSPDGSTWHSGIVIDKDDGKVSFPSGISPANMRERLAANRTYYVSTAGSDSNDGLGAGAPFATIQKAIDTVAALDLGGFDVTIQVADGTHTGNIAVYAPWVGRGTVTLLGNTTTPANCVLSTAGPAITVGILGSGTTAASPARLALGGFKIATSSNGDAISVNESSRVAIVAGMEYGSVGTGRHLIVRRHSIVSVGANYTISGGAASHFLITQNAIFVSAGLTVTLSGSPVFSGGFGNVQRQSGAVVNGMTFSGTTGSSSKRYALLTGGLIDTAGGGASYLPGDTAGTNDGTGIYA